MLRRDQILVLIAKDFKLKYNSTALGFLWSLLVPAFTSIVYYFVFGIMMRFDAPNYLLYLMSGTFLWQFFSNVVIMDGGVLMANQGLLKKKLHSIGNCSSEGRSTPNRFTFCSQFSCFSG